MTALPRTFVAVFVLALSGFALSGCGLFGGGRAADTPPGAGPEAPAGPTGPATVELSGTATMNAGGNAARVFLYPLSSDATFLSTPAQVFWDDPAAALGSDVVGVMRDATVRPGDTATLGDVALGAAAFLGIAVDLRAPEGTSWRAVVPAASVRGQTLTVTVDEKGLRVAPR